MTGLSFDGGTSWTRLAVPFARCAGGSVANGGDYQRATDPWVTFSPNGIAHQIALSSSGGIFQPSAVNAVLVSRSGDGGVTWGNPVTLIRDSEQFFNDKESITADRTDPRFVYAVWGRLAAAGGLINFFTQIDAGPNNTATAFLAVIRSADKGLTWSLLIRIADSLAVGSRYPETGTPIRDAASLGSIAVLPAGELFAGGQDACFSSGARDGHRIFPFGRWDHLAREPGGRAFRSGDRAERRRTVSRRLSGTHQHRRRVRAVLRTDQQRQPVESNRCIR